MESAVSLTKALRWDIQSLGVRLAKAATAEESSRRKSNKANSRASHEAEIRLIVQDIRNLLTRIEDAVPLINLAITTSGVNLSTSLPPTVSPSRLLQASTFLTAGDTQYSMAPGIPVQVGPAFILSLYMLFAGHSYRTHKDQDTARDMTWKEVIHKAKVKLMRIPIHHKSQDNFYSADAVLNSVEEHEGGLPSISGERQQNEYAYHLEIVEDLEDDRVHSFEDGEPQPGPYKDVRLAGIREFLPIHQISKIFYADTGKILDIGTQGETNSPVLLLKRDINARPPRRMMEESEASEWYEEMEEPILEEPAETEEEIDSDDEVEQQLRRESSFILPKENGASHQSDDEKWRLPADLDPEWLAFEVYNETDDASEEEHDSNDDSAYASHRPSSSGQEQSNESLTDELSRLDLDQNPASSPYPADQVTSSGSFSRFMPPKPSPFGSIRTSLSLLEMLIRLTALQQFQQASHLSIADELLTFFLEESSTTGAGGDGEERRRTRREARQKVGFDPYDESPVKRHGEDYQYQNQDHEAYGDYSRGQTPYEEYGSPAGYIGPSPRLPRYQSGTPQRTPEPWLLRSSENMNSSRATPELPSSPVSPYRPQKKTTHPLDRLQQERGVGKSSPLGRGRGISVETDSTLGTSPGTPALLNKDQKV